MPRAGRHLQLELLILPLALAILRIFDVRFYKMGVFGICYIFSSLMLSPDLDLPASKILKRWGWLRVIWVPYQKMFKHRGMSHNLIFGPLTRIAYLTIILTIAIMVLDYLLGWLEFPQGEFKISFSIVQDWLPIVFMGLYIPNFLHIVYDKLHTHLWFN